MNKFCKTANYISISEACTNFVSQYSRAPLRGAGAVSESVHLSRKSNSVVGNLPVHAV